MDMNQFRKHLAEASPKKNDDAHERALTKQCARDMKKTIGPVLKAVGDLAHEWQVLTDSSIDPRVNDIGAESWPFKHDDVKRAMGEFALWLSKMQASLEKLEK